jgi:nucleoside transporter
MNSSVALRLSVMMFLQFFTWGAWFTTAGPAIAAAIHGELAVTLTGEAYGSAPLAAIIAPLFLGIVADRFFASQVVMGILFLTGGAAMCAVPVLVGQNRADLIGWLFLGHMLCYMPTLGLGNTVAFANVADSTMFPRIRVWGTIGWIAAGLLVGFMGWSASMNIFWLAGISSVVLGVYSFTLPHTPPPAKGQPVDVRAIFMLDALSLLAKPAFAVFAICSTLICIPLAYYYGVSAYYLSDVGFTQPASSMTIGQMSEIIFMVLIPFFFRKLGVKWMILIGMLAWVARYLLYAFGAPEQITWMLFAAIALHGICYDFFFVTGFIYTENTAPRAIRGQAQSLLVFLTQGVGMFFGYWVAFSQFASVKTHGALDKAISSARLHESAAAIVKAEGVSLEAAMKMAAEVQPTFGEKLAQMFSVRLPEVDPELLNTTMAQWKSYWMLPAGMAAVIAVVFFLGFWDRGGRTNVSEGEVIAAGGKEELP